MASGQELTPRGQRRRRHAGDSRAARQIEDHMFPQLGAGTDKAHVPEQHVDKLGQFVQLPAAQKGTNRGKTLIVCRGDGMVRFIGDMDHCAKLKDGECPAVTSHALLQEHDRPPRGKAHRRGNGEHERDQHRQRQQHASGFEYALGR